MAGGDALQVGLGDDIGGAVHLKEQELLRLRVSQGGEVLVHAGQTAQLAVEELEVGEIGVLVGSAQAAALIDAVGKGVLVVVHQGAQQQGLTPFRGAVLRQGQGLEIEPSGGEQVGGLVHICGGVAISLDIGLLAGGVGHVVGAANLGDLHVVQHLARRQLYAHILVARHGVELGALAVGVPDALLIGQPVGPDGLGAAAHAVGVEFVQIGAVIALQGGGGRIVPGLGVDGHGAVHAAAGQVHVAALGVDSRCVRNGRRTGGVEAGGLDHGVLGRRVGHRLVGCVLVGHGLEIVIPLLIVRVLGIVGGLVGQILVVGSLLGVIFLLGGGIGALGRVIGRLGVLIGGIGVGAVVVVIRIRRILGIICLCGGIQGIVLRLGHKVVRLHGCHRLSAGFAGIDRLRGHKALIDLLIVALVHAAGGVALRSGECGRHRSGSVGVAHPGHAKGIAVRPAGELQVAGLVAVHHDVGCGIVLIHGIHQAVLVHAFGAGQLDAGEHQHGVVHGVSRVGAADGVEQVVVLTHGDHLVVIPGGQAVGQLEGIARAAVAGELEGDLLVGGVKGQRLYAAGAGRIDGLGTGGGTGQADLHAGAILFCCQGSDSALAAVGAVQGRPGVSPIRSVLVVVVDGDADELQLIAEKEQLHVDAKGRTEIKGPEPEDLIVITGVVSKCHSAADADLDIDLSLQNLDADARAHLDVELRRDLKAAEAALVLGAGHRHSLVQLGILQGGELDIDVLSHGGRAGLLEHHQHIVIAVGGQISLPEVGQRRGTGGVRIGLQQHLAAEVQIKGFVLRPAQHRGRTLGQVHVLAVVLGIRHARRRHQVVACLHRLPLHIGAQAELNVQMDGDIEVDDGAGGKPRLVGEGQLHAQRRGEPAELVVVGHRVVLEHEGRGYGEFRLELLGGHALAIA